MSRKWTPIGLQLLNSKSYLGDRHLRKQLPSHAAAVKRGMEPYRPAYTRCGCVASPVRGPLWLSETSYPVECLGGGEPELIYRSESTAQPAAGLAPRLQRARVSPKLIPGGASLLNDRCVLDS